MANKNIILKDGSDNLYPQTKVENITDLNTLGVTSLSSGSATNGQVPTANGSGGITWQTPSAGTTYTEGDGIDISNDEISYSYTPDDSVNSAMDFQDNTFLSTVDHIITKGLPWRYSVGTPMICYHGTSTTKSYKGTQQGKDIRVVFNLSTHTFTITEFKTVVGNMSSESATNGQVAMSDGSGGVSWQTPSTGMTNPMTTQGDLIVGGSSGAATRLAKGSAGQVLTMNSGATAPEWVTPISYVEVV